MEKNLKCPDCKQPTKVVETIKGGDKFIGVDRLHECTSPKCKTKFWNRKTS